MELKRRNRKEVATFEGLAKLMMGEFGRVDGRLDTMDARFDKMDDHFENIAEHLLSIEGELKSIRLSISAIEKRLDALEESVRDMRGYAKEIDDLRAQVRALTDRIKKCEAASARG